MKHDPLFEFERTSLERLKLAAEVILAEVRDYSQLAFDLGEPPESGKCDDLIPSPLEAELVIFKERVETALLLPRDAECGGIVSAETPRSSQGSQ